jgi:hypothetical protein
MAKGGSNRKEGRKWVEGKRRQEGEKIRGSLRRR